MQTQKFFCEYSHADLIVKVLFLKSFVATIRYKFSTVLQLYCVYIRTYIKGMFEHIEFIIMHIVVCPILHVDFKCLHSYIAN